MIRSNSRKKSLFVRLAGRVSIESMESRLLMTTNSWKSAVSGSWEDASRWSLGHVPTSSEDVSIVVAGTYTVGIHGNNVDSAKSVTLGTASSHTETLSITADDVTGYSLFTVASGFTNNGAVVIGNTSVNGYYSGLTVSSGVLTNGVGASFTATAAANASNSASNDGFTGTIVNAGTINVATTKGFRFSGSITGSGGSIAVVAGAALTVSASAANNALAGAYSFTGPGTVAFSGNFAMASGGATLAGGGPVQFGGTISGTGTLTVKSGTTLSLKGNGTTFSCPVVNSAGATLTIIADDVNGYSIITVANNITNNGALIIGNTSVNGYYSGLTVSSGTLSNSATGTFTASAVSNVSNGAANDAFNGTLANAGTINITSNKGFKISGSVASTNGKIAVASNSGLTIASVTGSTLGGTFVLSGPGLVAFSGTFALAAGGVTLSGSGPCQFGGTINGPGLLTIASGFTLTLVGNGTTINSPLLNSAGATINITANDTLGYAIIVVANGFTNNGAIIIGNTSVNGYYSGLTVSTGTLTNSATGTITASAASNVSGGAANDSFTGSIANAGTISITSIKGFKITGSVTSNNGKISVASNSGLIVAATTGSTLGGIFNLTGSGTVAVNGSYAIAAGGATFGGGGHWQYVGTLGGPGTLTNATSLDLVGNGTTINAPLVNAAAGSIAITANDTIGYSIITVASGFTNSGRITIGNTSINGYYSSLTISSGTLTNAAGATFTASAASNVNTGAANDSFIGNLSNAGTFNLSSPFGFKINGNYTQTSTGSFAPNLPTAAAHVSGKATLGGLLDIYQAATFVPTLGTTYPVLTYVSRSGDFTVIDGFSLGGGFAVTKSTGSTECDLKAVKAPADSTAPAAASFALTTPAVLAKTITFSETFTDNIAVSAKSLASTNVTVTGPGGFSQAATLVSVSKSNNGTPRVAVYSFSPVGGRVDVEANGVYTVKLNANSVKDTTGNAVAAKTLGTITLATAAKLVFTTQPPKTATAGKAVAPSVVVKIEDQAGNVITTDTSTVTIGVGTGPSGATVTGTASVAAKAGVATFSNLLLTKAGTYTLKATDGSDTAGISSSLVVNPAAAAKLVFLQSPVASKVGKPITPAVTVLIEDSLGNIVTTNTTTVKLTTATAPSGGALSGTVSVAAVAGKATFSNLLLSKAGSYSLKATDGSLVAVTSSVFAVS